MAYLVPVFNYAGFQMHYSIGSYRYVITNISSVVQFHRWWVLKSKFFGQESTCHQGKSFKKFLRVMTVCQKLGVILESKMVQKLSLEKSF